MFDPVKSYQESIVAKSRVPLKKSYKVLDLGCGRGDNTLFFSGRVKEAVGIDLESNFLENNLPKNVRFIKGNAEKTPFKDGYFDVVFMKDTLHHVRNIGKVLDEVKRVLKKEGVFIIVESNRYNPAFYFHMTRIERHNHFSKGFLSLLLEENGIKDFKIRTVHSRVYPVNILFVHKLAQVYEAFVERLPFFNNFCTYHIVSIRNKK